MTCFCDKEHCVFWPPAHCVDAAGSKSPILGDHRTFCAAFFHILPCRELGILQHRCLARGECSHQCITALVRVTQKATATTVLVRRYTNCRVKRGYVQHCESMIVQDASLLSLLRSSGSDLTLTLFLTVQPCHHSGGSDADPLDSRSCVTLLLDWKKQYLDPLGVKLQIRFPNIYKAAWQFSPQEQQIPSRCFSRSSQNARTGLIALLHEGIVIGPPTINDWSFLMSLTTTTPTVHMYMTDQLWLERLHADCAVAKFLLDLHANSKKRKHDNNDTRTPANPVNPTKPTTPATPTVITIITVPAKKQK